MQFVSLLLSLLLVLQFSLTTRAATINYAPAAQAGSSASIQGDIPVGKVGNLVLSNGVASLSGNTVDIVGTPAGSTGKKTLLSGVIIKTNVTGSGKTAKVEGIAYFRQGTALAGIDDPNAEELIDLTDGGVVSGHIVSVNRDEVEVDQDGRRRRFAMTEIKFIHSPRAFAFALIMAGATAITLDTAFSGSSSKISFTSTFNSARATANSSSSQTKVSKPENANANQSSSPSAHPFVKTVLVWSLVLALLGTAIAVPIAVGVANSHHGPSASDQATSALAISQFNSRFKPVTPVYSAPSSP